jgi:hypothetical protein
VVGCITGTFFFFQEGTVKGHVEYVGKLHTATIALRCVVPAEWRAPIFGKLSVGSNVVSLCVEQLMMLAKKLTDKKKPKLSI